jgi:hypothetical protein
MEKKMNKFDTFIKEKNKLYKIDEMVTGFQGNKPQQTNSTVGLPQSGNTQQPTQQPTQQTNQQQTQQPAQQPDKEQQPQQPAGGVSFKTAEEAMDAFTKVLSDPSIGQKFQDLFINKMNSGQQTQQ